MKYLTRIIALLFSCSLEAAVEDTKKTAAASTKEVEIENLEKELLAFLAELNKNKLQEVSAKEVGEIEVLSAEYQAYLASIGLDIPPLRRS